MGKGTATKRKKVSAPVATDPPTFLLNERVRVVAIRRRGRVAYDLGYKVLVAFDRTREFGLYDSSGLRRMDGKKTP